jgi:hypothetical protein
MSIGEAIAAQYMEPEPTDLKEIRFLRLPIIGRLRRRKLDTLLNDGYRLRAINMGRVMLEPIQPGVLRYPPVQVGVPKDPDFISRYIDMPPTAQSEVSFSQELKEDT